MIYSIRSRVKDKENIRETNDILFRLSMTSMDCNNVNGLQYIFICQLRRSTGIPLHSSDGMC